MWEEDEFGVIRLTSSFNEQPMVPGQIGAIGIFEEDGVSTTTVKVEEQDGNLSLVEPTERGGPGVTVGDDERRTVTFDVDHYEVNDRINADEVQGVREFGSDSELETIQGRIDRKLAIHARNFDMTLEHQRVGAIKGVVVSGKGRVLHDLYNRFGLAVPAPVSLGLGSDVKGIATKIKGDVVYQIEDALDVPYGHIHAMCGRDFHDQLWEQAEIRATFLADNQGYQLRDGAPDVFRAGKVTFERYKTGRRAKEAHGNSGFIADDEAQAFPVGVPGLFLTRFAPADLEETVNTIGLPRYARQYAMQNGKGRHLDVQMNAISLCARPTALLRLTV